MNRGQILPETLRQLDESVYKLTEISQDTECRVNSLFGSHLEVPQFPRDSKFTSSRFDSLATVKRRDYGESRFFDVHRHSKDLWVINDRAKPEDWSRSPEEPFLEIAERASPSGDTVGEKRGQKLLGMLNFIILVNESRNY